MQKFEIRWNDLDPNRHLKNSSFVDLMSQARMNFLKSAGIGHKILHALNLGPVVFYEHIYYFREVAPDDPIFLSVGLKGVSKERTFFEFEHNMYNTNGENLAYCELMGGWMDLNKRKLTPVPEILAPKIDTLDHADNFRILTKKDTRKNGRRPKDISPIED